MFDKFFAKKPKVTCQFIGPPIYAIGDVHGRADLLEQMLDLIANDAARHDQQSKLVFLGDYVDRGPNSDAVIERLIKLREERPNTYFLKGNHEACLLEFLESPDEKQHWLDWGGEETLESYGVFDIMGRTNDDIAVEFRERLPQHHLDFLTNLELTHEQDGYLFVHAGIRPGVALDDQEEKDLLWIRTKFHEMTEAERPAQIIVHGHQVERKPLDLGWRIGVDTGACWTGKLTALAIDHKRRRFIST